MADFYATCPQCIVKEWCKRRSGESPLPDNYLVTPDCDGFLRIERAQLLANIPQEYKTATLRNYQFDIDNQHFQQALTQTVQKITDMIDLGTNIGFTHPHTGTGKTFTSCMLLNEFILKTCMTPRFNYEAALGYYVKFGRWANELRNQYQLNDSDYTYSVMQHFQRMQVVPLLILDDIGSGRMTDYIRDMTYDLIDYRKEHNLSTIFTTNYSMSQLESSDLLGTRVTSRLYQNTILYQMGGRDKRKERTISL